MANRRIINRLLSSSLSPSSRIAASHQYRRWLVTNHTLRSINTVASHTNTISLDIDNATSPPITAANLSQRLDLATDRSEPLDHDHEASEIEEQTDDSTPWFLRDQPLLQQSVSQPQPLPDLPQNPPPILSPLQSYIAHDLGMNDLSLLDLRSLDPPAALGSNLLMLLCTARSEKHLHISADRLCRWIRTEYVSKPEEGMLAPVADGLLGRSEMKIKLKRKEKRSRILSAVGAIGRVSDDDGIRTGWVCVNLGIVRGGMLEDAESNAGADVVGFREITTGARIVVQLMTEEKRGQLELEVLWKGILNKSNEQRRQRLIAQAQNAA